MKGPKTGLYIYQRDGNNLPPLDVPPSYSGQWGFADGAQTDIFTKSSNPAGDANLINPYATATGTQSYTYVLNLGALTSVTPIQLLLPFLTAGRLSVARSTRIPDTSLPRHTALIPIPSRCVSTAATRWASRRQACRAARNVGVAIRPSRLRWRLLPSAIPDVPVTSLQSVAVLGGRRYTPKRLRQ